MSEAIIISYVVGTLAGVWLSANFFVAKGAEAALSYMVDEGFAIAEEKEDGEVIFKKVQ